MKVLDKLFNKADQTEARYQKALESKEESLIALQAELSEKQFLLKDMHKMKLLGDISEAAYDKEKEVVDKLQKKVAESQKELELIQEYETEDVKSIIEELDEAKAKHRKEHNAELHALKTELLEAKLAYVEKMVEVSEKYNKLVNPERKLDALKIKAGIKKNSYVSGTHDALSMISVPNGGYENLRVEQKDIYDALEYQRTSSQLKLLIEKYKA
ncbi:hypothetical protein V7068_21825 [Bacillus sp. JJ634]